MDESGDLIAVARFVKPKGLKGELVADILTDFPERFENLDRVIVQGKGAKPIEYFRFEKNRILLKLQSVDSVEDAESYRDLDACVPESEAVDLEEDEFFDWELVDCRVVSKEGKVIGQVKEIFRAGENVNLVVASENGEHMVPFVKAICTEVDLKNKVITADIPEGLLDW